MSLSQFPQQGQTSLVLVMAADMELTFIVPNPAREIAGSHAPSSQVHSLPPGVDPLRHGALVFTMGIRRADDSSPRGDSSTLVAQSERELIAQYMIEDARAGVIRI